MKLGMTYYTENSCPTLCRKVNVNAVELENRKEISIILRSLRRSKYPGAVEAAKTLWRVHTGFKKCPHCGTLVREIYGGYFPYSRGYQGVCSKCYDLIRDEIRRQEKSNLKQGR